MTKWLTPHYFQMLSKTKLQWEKVLCPVKKHCLYYELRYKERVCVLHIISTTAIQSFKTILSTNVSSKKLFFSYYNGWTFWMNNYFKILLELLLLECFCLNSQINNLPLYCTQSRNKTYKSFTIIIYLSTILQKLQAP